MKWRTALLTLVSLVILGLLILFVIVPAPVKLLIRRTFYTANYEPLPEARVRDNYTLYSAGNNRSLIVIFIGGGFLFKNINTHYGLANELYKRARDRYDVMVLRYPVRFTYTLRDAMLSINESLKDALRYDACHALGYSAGALLAGTFIKKERDKRYSELIKVPQIGLGFKSFVGICGFYNTDISNALLSSLFNFYILRNTPNAQSYSCYNINVPRYLVSSTHDMLFYQTAKYIRSEECEYHVYRKVLPHTFVQLLNLPESLDAIERILGFLDRTDKRTSTVAIDEAAVATENR